MARRKSRGKMVSAEMLCLLAEQMLNWGVRRGGERKDRGLIQKDIAGSKWEAQKGNILYSSYFCP